MNQNYFLKIMLVIFLTVFFSIIASAISNPTLLVSLFLGATTVATSITVTVSLQKLKLIHESIPTFLNFVNLTMSTGKSFANSFETAILYQKKSIQPFYQRIHHMIFYLNEPNSGFYFEFQTNFYNKLVQIASQSSQQREKVHKMKLYFIERMEVRRREKSLRAPFLIQTIVFCVLFFTVLVWHINFRSSYPKIERISFIFFGLGLFFSFIVGKPSQKI